MAYLRFKALEKLPQKHPLEIIPPSDKISDYFSTNAFGLEKMQETLSPDVFERVKHYIDKDKKIDNETADAVAAAAKTWRRTRSLRPLVTMP